MLKLTFIDTESAWDADLHKAYCAIDPGEAKRIAKHDLGKHLGEPRHRQACKRIFAAACLDIEIDSSGALSIIGMRSWTEHSHGDEEAVVGELLDHLRLRPDNKAVTFGGLAADLPLLTLAAMEHNLVLPPQLRNGQRIKPGEFRPHTDLALELKGQGREWAHLSEIGLRLGLPGALFANKKEVSYPRSADEWQRVRGHVELDTVLTAMVTLTWLAVQGRVRIDRQAVLFLLADWHRRYADPSDPLAEPMRELCRAMLARIGARLDEAA